MKTLTQENTPECPKGNFPEVVTIRTYTWEGGKKGEGGKVTKFPSFSPCMDADKGLQMHQ